MDKVLFWINTFNRPHLLKLLIDDIISQKEIDADILIYNDKSSNKFLYTYNDTIKNAKEKINIEYIYMKENYGKFNYWKLLNLGVKNILSRKEYDFYFHLDDDIRLLGNDCMKKFIDMWNKIEDEKKICVMPLNDERVLKNQWNDIKPEAKEFSGEKFIKIGWIDDIFISKRELLEKYYPIPRIPRKRWKDNPNLSSGTGRNITQKLRVNNRTIYALPLDNKLIHHDYNRETNPSMINRKR